MIAHERSLTILFLSRFTIAASEILRIRWPSKVIHHNIRFPNIIRCLLVLEGLLWLLWLDLVAVELVLCMAPLYVGISGVDRN